jgi:16S rRNA (uracil1498-N3)-methyltransferase
VLITDVLPPVPEPLPLVTCMALLKGDAMDRAVQKCTEIGVTAIVLLDTEFTNVARDEVQRAKRLSHLNRIVSSACEQSGATWRPGLTGSLTLVDALATEEVAGTPQKIVLHPEGEPLPLTLPRVPTALFTGPEGGWSDAELADFTAAGVMVYRLGSQVLRAETAPLAGLAAIRHGWGWID